MPNVLTTQSRVLCGPDTGTNHGGRVATASAAKLTVAGNRVLLRSGIGPGLSTPCKTPASSPPKPCTKVNAIISGDAVKLTAGGSAVMLDSLSGTTDGNPIGTLPATAEQTKLTAV
jgi:hypothetical protein